MNDYQYRAVKRPINKTKPEDNLWTPITNRSGKAGPYDKESTAKGVINLEKRHDNYLKANIIEMLSEGRKLMPYHERAAQGFEYDIQRTPVPEWEHYDAQL